MNKAVRVAKIDVEDESSIFCFMCAMLLACKYDDFSLYSSIFQFYSY